MSLLSVEDLSISFPDGQGGRTRVVDGVSFALEPRERLGVIGESGSGKTMIGRAILGLLPAGGRVEAGRILWEGRDVVTMPAPELRAIRGARIGMVFQEPMTSLNPSLTIGRQMTEGPMLHQGLSRRAAEDAAVAMLTRVAMADPRAVLHRHPHEFSGGMRQRIMLASVLMLRPALLIADEPTTALDAVIQRDIMDLADELVADTGTTLMLVSHDLPLVAQHTERAIIMEAGRVVESGPIARILKSPAKAYTARLVRALPRPGTGAPRETPPVVELRDVSVTFRTRPRNAMPWARATETRAVDGVSLTVREGEIVGLVGQSGSGKTTLGRAALDLVPMSAGTVLLDGKPRPRDFRRDMQIIFQDPYSSLDPRRDVASIVAAGLRHRGMDRATKSDRVAELLSAVRLPVERYGGRLPHQLSGGQRQRVCIARALVTHPRFVVADEPVSALDLTVQKEVLALIADLQVRFGFCALFVSHDMAVIEQIAERVVIMKDGKIVETGSRADIFAHPKADYTRRLLSAVPRIEAA